MSSITYKTCPTCGHFSLNANTGVCSHEDCGKQELSSADKFPDPVEFVFEDDTVEAALERAAAEVPSRREGKALIRTDQVVSDGKPKIRQFPGVTIEAAIASTKASLPAGAVLLNQRTIQEPTSETIELEAEDRESASKLFEQRRGTSSAFVWGVKELMAPQKKLFGLIRSKGKYQANLTTPAIIEITYKEKALVRVVVKFAPPPPPPPAPKTPSFLVLPADVIAAAERYASNNSVSDNQGFMGSRARAGDWEGAIPYALAVFLIQGKTEALLHFTGCCYQTVISCLNRGSPIYGKFEEYMNSALAAYTHILKNDANDTQALAGRGGLNLVKAQSVRRLDLLAEAEEDCRKAIRLGSPDAAGIRETLDNITLVRSSWSVT